MSVQGLGEGEFYPSNSPHQAPQLVCCAAATNSSSSFCPISAPICCSLHSSMHFQGSMSGCIILLYAPQFLCPLTLCGIT